MRLLAFTAFLCLISNAVASPCETDQLLHHADCEQQTTEYEKYRECMEHRFKRSTPCQNECSACDCTSCDTSCESSGCADCCGSCCEQRRPQCATYSCCHRSCRADCRSATCRTSCKKQCQSDYTSANSYPAPQAATQVNSSVRADHNVTTIIHLNNLINNTNLIHLPVQVNNTNINNITVEAGRGEVIEGEVTYVDDTFGSQANPVQRGPQPEEYQPPQVDSVKSSHPSDTKEENCCLVVGPRECVPQKDFPFMRCFHIRKRACGFMCTAPVVHYQRHEVCDNEAAAPGAQPCREQLVYVPQPRPDCVYQQQWPFFSCGGYQTPGCEGCGGRGAGRCSPFCYEGADARRPAYGPAPGYAGYAPAPSCAQGGPCAGPMGGMGNLEFPNVLGFKSGTFAVESASVDKVARAVSIQAKVEAGRKEGGGAEAEITIVPKAELLKKSNSS